MTPTAYDAEFETHSGHFDPALAELAGHARPTYSDIPLLDDGLAMMDDDLELADDFGWAAGDPLFMGEGLVGRQSSRMISPCD